MVALAYHYLQPQFQGACAGVPVPQRVVLVNWAFVHLPLGLCLCQKCLFSLFPLSSVGMNHPWLESGDSWQSGERVLDGLKCWG